MRPFTAALLAVLACMVVPAAAGAATVTLSEQVKGQNLAGSFLADAGETNDVTIFGDSAALVVHDGGAPIAPAGRCTSIDANTVRCDLPPGGSGIGVSFFRVNLEDGNDSLRLAFAKRQLVGLVEASGNDGNDRLDATGTDDAVALDGGADNDLLLGSAGDDLLDGGPGADRLVGGGGDDHLWGDGPYALPESPPARDQLDGGAGRDLAEYDTSTGSVVDLGNPSRNEDALTSIEDLAGGRGPDVLRGDGGDNNISGGGGEDVLAGGAGNDHLRGGTDVDRLDAGPGNDVLQPETEPDATVLRPADTVRCGPGLDRIIDAAGASRPGSDCEALSIASPLQGTPASFFPLAPMRARDGALTSRPICPVYLTRSCLMQFRIASGRDARLNLGKSNWVTVTAGATARLTVRPRTSLRRELERRRTIVVTARLTVLETSIVPTYRPEPPRRVVWEWPVTLRR